MFSYSYVKINTWDSIWELPFELVPALEGNLLNQFYQILRRMFCYNKESIVLQDKIGNYEIMDKFVFHGEIM